MPFGDSILGRLVRGVRNSFGGDNSDDASDANAASATTQFDVGETVFVKARTWPGINKEGGVGTIKAIDNSSGTADVVYIIGRRTTEPDIPFEYIAKYDGGRRTRSTRGGSVRSVSKLQC